MLSFSIAYFHPRNANNSSMLHKLEQVENESRL